MPRKGAETREQILDAAEQLFLAQGYGGTPVDAIVERTGLTKGAFFHHFASKHDLARALMERYAALDHRQFEDHLERARRLSRDPLQQVLIVVGLYEEMMERRTDPFPGCLFASYCYQAGLFGDEVHAIIRASLLEWREVVGSMLAAAMAARPPRLPVDAAEVADMFLAVTEGAFVLSKTLDEPALIAKQIRQYRNYLELLFGMG
jgi:TetR/AcrR family transcriptional repressor of nem operon